MRVMQAIEQLKKMPPHAEIFHIWDGEARTAIEHIYVSKGGDVMTADEDMNVYTDSSRPVDAPSSIDKPYWKTPSL